MVKKPYNYKRAECVGLFGYGNGRDGKEFCSTKCPKAKTCWAKTTKRVKETYPPAVMFPYFSAVEKAVTKYGEKKGRRVAVKKLIDAGKIDPYLDQVMLNTQMGVEHQPDSMRQFKGGSWYQHGNVISYHV